MNGCCTKVRRLDTGEVYPSINVAAQKMFMCPSVLSAAKNKGKAEVFGIPIEFIETSIGGRARRVRCVETGTEYLTQTAAAKAVGVSVWSIRDAINKGHRSGGFHWRTMGK